MEVFILILTLITNGGNDGQGGVATAEFNDLNTCRYAGNKWVEKANNHNTWAKSSFYLCIPKKSRLPR